MIILDTNVISEPTTKAPDERVTAWLDAQVNETLYLSAVTVGELRYGIAVMPAGRRRDEFAEWLENYTVPAFAGRILLCDLAATAEYARLMSAARDTAPFEAAGVPVIDPWQ